MRTIVRLFLTAFAFAAFAPGAREARACMPSEFETPLCAVYWRSEVVFVAEVKAIDAAFASETNEDGVYAKIRKARLHVEEVLRGEIADEVSAELGNGADCLPLYKKGRRYLVYASEYNAAMGEVYTMHYSEITPDDGEYIESVRAFSKPRAEAQVSGKVLSETLRPWAGVEVTMESGGQSYSTVTDDKGGYSFAFKPGGEFKVSMIFPFRALDEGFAGVEYLSEEPDRTVLGYRGALQAGQCHYVEPHVSNVPIQR